MRMVIRMNAQIIIICHCYNLFMYTTILYRDKIKLMTNNLLMIML